MNPILYGPDDKPLPAKDADTGSTRTVSRRPRLATRWARYIRAHIPILWQSTSSRILALSTLLGIVVLYPRVSITPGEDTGSADPLHIFITVSNNGQFSIYSTKLSCKIDRMVNLSNQNLITQSTVNEAIDLPIGTLAGGGYTTTACPSGVAFLAPGNKFYGHVTVVLSFRPPEFLATPNIASLLFARDD